MNNLINEAKRELCTLIACDYNNRLLRWTEAGDDILIHSVFNNDVVCRTVIYTTRYGTHLSYYLHFCDKKYKNAAVGINDSNLVTVTEASGYKFNCASDVISFVREVLRRVNQEKINYTKHDCDATYDLLTTPTVRLFEYTIKDVIFNDPATIVLWSDGTKTVVKCRDGEEFDPEKGLALALAKKAMGNKYNYYDVFKKYVGKYNKKKLNKKDEIVTMPKSLADTWKAQDKALRDIALNTAKNLRAEGKSLAEIAKIMGYDDPAVVRSILPDEE